MYEPRVLSNLAILLYFETDLNDFQKKALAILQDAYNKQSTQLTTALFTMQTLIDDPVDQWAEIEMLLKIMGRETVESTLLALPNW